MRARLARVPDKGPGSKDKQPHHGWRARSFLAELALYINLSTRTRMPSAYFSSYICMTIDIYVQQYAMLFFQSLTVNKQCQLFYPFILSKLFIFVHRALERKSVSVQKYLAIVRLVMFGSTSGSVQ